MALDTGYITNYDTNKERSQVLFTLQKDLTISCFDSTLKLLWNKQLAHKLHDIQGLLAHYNIQNIAIHAIPISITQNSDSLVVIGFNMIPNNIDSESRIRLEQGMGSEDGSSGNRTEHIGIDIQSQLDHFTIYALNATDGSIIWRHDGIDMKPEQYIRSLPMNALKLGLIADLTTKATVATTNHGLNDWSVFRQSLFAELPHIWRSSDDTSIRIAHFVRRHLGAGSTSQVDKKGAETLKNSGAEYDSSHITSSTNKANKKASATSKHFNIDLNRFTGIERQPLSLSASLPHDAAEHTQNPNVLVAHTSKGLEVISLRSGTPITSLSLKADRLYDDLDGDGVLDSIAVLESENDVAEHSLSQLHDNARLRHCMMVVISGLPQMGQLFNGTICQSQRHLHDAMKRPAFNRHDTLPRAIKAATPVVYNVLDDKTLLISKYKEIAVAINTGVMTSYNSRGVYRWQMDHTPTWSLDYTHAYAGLYDTDAARVDELGDVDRLHAHILVMGEKAFALVDPKNGDVLTVTDLPDKPIAHPILGVYIPYIVHTYPILYILYYTYYTILTILYIYTCIYPIYILYYTYIIHILKVYIIL